MNASKLVPAPQSPTPEVDRAWLLLNYAIFTGLPASTIYRLEQWYLKRRYESLGLPVLAKMH